MPQEMDVVRILILYANNIVPFEGKTEEGEDADLLYRIGDIILHELNEDELFPEDPVNLRIFNFFAQAAENEFPKDVFFLHHQDEEVSQRAINLTSSPHLLSENWKEKHQIFISSESDLMFSKDKIFIII